VSCVHADQWMTRSSSQRAKNELVYELMGRRQPVHVCTLAWPATFGPDQAWLQARGARSAEISIAYKPLGWSWKDGAQRGGRRTPGSVIPAGNRNSRSVSMCLWFLLFSRFGAGQHLASGITSSADIIYQVATIRSLRQRVRYIPVRACRGRIVCRTQAGLLIARELYFCGLYCAPIGRRNVHQCNA
jgi:hypothetical protein